MTEINNRIEEVKKILSQYIDKVKWNGKSDMRPIDYDWIAEDEAANQICQLFPQPLDDEELEKAIQDILDTLITVDNECNEITKKAQILALLQPKIEEARRQERERIIAKVESVLGIKNDFGNVHTEYCSWVDWQALKGGE